jgi:superfamily II DNA/RNA helicase
MEGFKNKKFNILIATDVASRGIHVERVSHIFNYELPHDINYYIHRIGRTGRMSDVGDAVSICYSDEMGTLGQIERLMGKQVEEKILPDYIPAPKFTKTPREERPFRQGGSFRHSRPSGYSEGRNRRGGQGFKGRNFRNRRKRWN